ncbi:hypothetical protein YB2330_004457 [Saitoella coloradoensis]
MSFVTDPAWAVGERAVLHQIYDEKLAEFSSLVKESHNWLNGYVADSLGLPRSVEETPEALQIENGVEKDVSVFSWLDAGMYADTMQLLSSGGDEFVDAETDQDQQQERALIAENRPATPEIEKSEVLPTDVKEQAATKNEDTVVDQDQLENTVDQVAIENHDKEEEIGMVDEPVPEDMHKIPPQREVQDNEEQETLAEEEEDDDVILTTEAPSEKVMDEEVEEAVQAIVNTEADLPKNPEVDKPNMDDDSTSRPRQASREQPPPQAALLRSSPPSKPAEVSEKSPTARRSTEERYYDYEEPTREETDDHDASFNANASQLGAPSSPTPSSAPASSLNFAPLPKRQPLGKKSLGKQTSGQAGGSRTSMLEGLLKNPGPSSYSLGSKKSLGLVSNPENVQEADENIDEPRSVDRVDEELHRGEERIKSVFSTGSMRIHEALNSLMSKKSMAGLGHLQTEATPKSVSLPRDDVESAEVTPRPAAEAEEPEREDDEDRMSLTPKAVTEKEEVPTVEKEAQAPASTHGVSPTLDYESEDDWVPKVDFISQTPKLPRTKLQAQVTGSPEEESGKLYPSLPGMDTREASPPRQARKKEAEPVLASPVPTSLFQAAKMGASSALRFAKSAMMGSAHESPLPAHKPPTASEEILTEGPVPVTTEKGSKLYPDLSSVTQTQPSAALASPSKIRKPPVWQNGSPMKPFSRLGTPVKSAKTLGKGLDDPFGPRQLFAAKDGARTPIGTPSKPLKTPLARAVSPVKLPNYMSPTKSFMKKDVGEAGPVRVTRAAAAAASVTNTPVALPNSNSASASPPPVEEAEVSRPREDINAPQLNPLAMAAKKTILRPTPGAMQLKANKPIIRVPTASQRTLQPPSQVSMLAMPSIPAAVAPAMPVSAPVAPPVAKPAGLTEPAPLESEQARTTRTAPPASAPPKHIKAMTAASNAKKKEQMEKERRAAQKAEIEKRRAENIQKQREEEERKRLEAQRKAQGLDANGEKKRKVVMEPVSQPAPKRPLRTVPSKQNLGREPSEEPVAGKYAPPQPQAQPTLKRLYEADPDIAESATASMRSAAPSSIRPVGTGLTQEAKRRRTEDVQQEQPSLTGKPMRASVARAPGAKLQPNKFVGSSMMSSGATKLQQQPKFAPAQTKTAGVPMVEGVKFSTDTIRFAGEPSAVPKAARPSAAAGHNVAHTPLPDTGNIELPEIDSEYSDEEDDDDVAKKKKNFSVPEWAESPELRQLLRRQQRVNPDDIFGPIRPLQMEEIFRGKGGQPARFRPRSSSANWSGQDKLTREEVEDYDKTMGYK